MIHNIKNNKGFTLIEIIIVIIVLGVLSVFGFSFISTAVHTYSKMEKQKGLFDQAVMAMERISRELRDANSISLPASGNSGSTLTFTKSHETLQDSDTEDISFKLSTADNSILQRVGTVTVNLADNVSTFTVARVTSGTSNEKEEITITLILQEAGAGDITLRSYICPKNLAFAAVAYSGRNFDDDWEEDIQ